jgi:hypothetical protein
MNHSIAMHVSKSSVRKSELLGILNLELSLHLVNLAAFLSEFDCSRSEIYSQKILGATFAEFDGKEAGTASEIEDLF